MRYDDKIHTVNIGLYGLRFGPSLSRHRTGNSFLFFHAIHFPHVEPSVEVGVQLLGLQLFQLPVGGETL